MTALTCWILLKIQCKILFLIFSRSFTLGDIQRHYCHCSPPAMLAPFLGDNEIIKDVIWFKQLQHLSHRLQWWAKACSYHLLKYGSFIFQSSTLALSTLGQCLKVFNISTAVSRFLMLQFQAVCQVYTRTWPATFLHAFLHSSTQIPEPYNKKKSIWVMYEVH